jgi:DNA modification methylase
MRVDLRHGDSRDVIKTLADASIDSVVCDPPYALVSIVKRFGGENAAPAKDCDVYARSSRGFMGKQWDTGEVAFDPAFWVDVMRVMKPGAHLLAFGGTRTYHRLAVAIEEAGFEIRDQIGWLYGSGFPKSHDVSKGIDKAAGAERKIVGSYKATGTARTLTGGNYGGGGHNVDERDQIYQTAPATDAAREWHGWGTALKPAWEPIVMARKPFKGTVAGNVQAHGTGAIYIDGCRVPGEYETRDRDTKGGASIFGLGAGGGAFVPAEGRWPANVIHDGSEDVLAAFPETNSTPPGNTKPSATTANVYGVYSQRSHVGHTDAGSAARFFYSAKADAGDRLGSKHPTVKPVDLMAYLCRLVTPPGGTVLDPFAGSGTTGMACMREGFNAVLIEREAEYIADIKRRIAHVSGQDAPLFGGTSTPPRNPDAEFTESSRTKNRPGRIEGVDA